MTNEALIAHPPTRMRLHRPLVLLAGLMMILALVSLAGLLVDDRTVNGSPVWLKPLKFAVSFALYGATLAWMLRLVRRGRWIAWWSASVAAVATAAEVGTIVSQAARGRASHFNVATPYDTAVYDLMGQLALVIWLSTFVLAVVVSVQRHSDRAALWAMRLGMFVSLAGMLVGVMMAQPTVAQQRVADAGGVLTVSGAHAVGAPDDGPAMPLTGWATTGGDLRIAHFVGIHALQALPLLAWLLTILARRHPRLAVPAVRVRLVAVGALGYAGLVALLVWQASRGRALLQPDGRTLLTAAALAAAVSLSAAVVVRRASVATT
ncbi:hypothetical protein ONA70_13975 [Micromonospora yasonensis]|uniref:hypothetical protein n=1 Tax=Micromonospora yasonensis TaxID=1128667 RepID=UPI00222E2AF4|nr:hypothetical protein [Micromonospora yasonensis]MCW3841210.1 hypothetical protein [Micromonospora yasonensis]